MFDEGSDQDRKKQSLLSFGAPASPSSKRSAGSLLAASADSDDDDPAARHRLARSRREAAPSPLLSALARMEGFHPEPAADEPKRRRWSFRDLLSEKLKFEKPASGPEGESRPAFATSPESRAEVPRPKPVVEPFAAAASRTHSREDDPPVAPFDGGGGPPGDEVFVAADAGPNDPHWRPLIDPMRVIGGLASSVWLILAATLVGGVLGAMVALSTPKKYEAFSELLVDPRDLKVSDRDLTQTGLTSDALLALVENQMRVLTSGTVLNKVVDRLKLDEDPEFNGQRKSFGLGSFIAGLRSLLSRGGAGAEDNRRAVAVDNLAEALHVERSGRTFIVTVSATTEDAEKSALIVNTIDEVFLQTTGELQSDTAGRAADELSARLEELRSGVEEAERNVEKFKAEHDLIDAQGRLISDDELVKLNDQLGTARARTIELNARAASVRSIRVDAVIGGGLPEELTSPVMSELRSQYASIKQEADRLSVRLGPRHPQYLATQAQLQGAREQIENELRRIVASVQTELKRAVQLEQDLAARLAQLKVRSGDVNGDLVTLRELEREATAKRAVYENYLLRAKEAGEQRDINTANISVISQAFPPLDPTGASRATITMTGAVFGLFAGIALGIGRGIFWSLRDKSRARRQSRPASRPDASSAPAIEPRRRAEPKTRIERSTRTVPREDPEMSNEEITGGMSGEAAKNPLVRLIERIRWPSAAASKSDTASPAAASPVTANANTKPQTEIPGREARASQEASPMYPYPQSPAYPQQQPAPASPYVQPPVQPMQYPPYPQAFAQPLQYPQPFPPQPVAYPYPPVVPPQPAFHGWQPQPAPVTPYGYPQPVASPYPAYPPAAPQPAYPQESRPMTAPAPEVRPAAPSREMSPIEEVRESLREFREAIRDLVEDRARRRYS